jgi:hypothetical protein
MQREGLTALDGIAVVITGFQAAVLFAFPWLAEGFVRMLSEFCRKDPFPSLTVLAMTVWFPVMLGATAAIGPVLGCIPAVPVRVRRRVLIAAFAFGCAALGVCVMGLYLPLFEMSGKINP